MVEKVFHDFVKGLCFYYERRDPREDAIEMWFQEVKHIPDEPVGWMSAQIRSRYESYPRNLPLVMRDLWQQWREDHPHRRAHGDVGPDCMDCKGTGLIFLSLEGSRYVFRCGKCRRSNLNGVPTALLIDLQARGYTLTNAARSQRQSHG